MAETSIGGVLAGSFLAILGLIAVVGGGYIVAETTFAESGEEKSEYGPFGLFGSSEEQTVTMQLYPLMGLLLALGGIAGTITGFVIAARSFERGKDRVARQDAT